MSITTQRILLVDDDPDIRELLSEFLAREGFVLDTASDGREMDAKLSQMRPDLILLDLMLPGEDGVSICRRLAGFGAPAIIMLTAKTDEVDRILGLEIGADDYVAKPFAPRELLARIRAVLRRAAPATTSIRNQCFVFGAFSIDVDARQLNHAEEGKVPLTSGELDLLVCFIQRPKRVLSRDYILDAMRGRGVEPFDRSIDMHVSRLRKKLLAAGAEPDLISTVRNAGYLFTSDVAPSE